jgi:hypothetical protein
LKKQDVEFEIRTLVPGILTQLFFDRKISMRNFEVGVVANFIVAVFLIVALPLTKKK